MVIERQMLVEGQNNAGRGENAGRGAKQCW